MGILSALNIFASDAPERSEKLEARVLRYRGAGSGSDGIHTLRGYQVDDLDYSLMGADNSSAQVNHPNVARDEIVTFEWFAIKRDSNLAKKSFGNSHGTSDDGGKTFYSETALMDIPRPEFQCAPEEVVWHHKRVTQLRAENVPQPERVRIMTEERKSRPWVRP